MLMRAATVVQQLCKSCRTCFMFYCKFYFTCDRSFNGVLNGFCVLSRQIYTSGSKWTVDGTAVAAAAHHCDEDRSTRHLECRISMNPVSQSQQPPASRSGPSRWFAGRPRDCGTLYILYSGLIRTLDMVTVGRSLCGTRLTRHA